MTRCNACRKPVDRNATLCPGCGAPRPRRGWPNPTVGFVLMASLGFIIFGIPALINGYMAGRKEALADHAAVAMRDVVALEKAYYARHGEFSINLEEATGPSWQMPDGGAYSLLLIRGMDGGSFCLEANSGTRPDVEELSMDEQGTLFHASGCPRPARPAGE